MRTLVALLVLPLAICAPLSSAQFAFRAPQEVIDRIVVRIEDDIITLSELRELAAYQQLVDGQAQADDRLRSELIEQWVINNEAFTARFSQPAESEVERELAKIVARFPSQQAYLDRLAMLGLSAEDVKRIVTREIYLARYLDYKFRPSIQVTDDDVAAYYRNELVPALTAKGEAPPSLGSVRDQIQEVLVQRGIDDRASSWLDQTRSRLRIEVEPSQALPLNEVSGSSPGDAK